MDTIEKQRKKAQLKNKITQIETLIQVLNRSVTRHKKSKDPMIRATLLVDKLCTSIDIGMAMLICNNYDFPEDLKTRMSATSSMINDEINFLLDWVCTPIYSPDHPIGNNIMKNAEKSFHNNMHTPEPFKSNKDKHVEDPDKNKEEKELKYRVSQIEVLLQVINRGISRHRRTGDPVIRATLLVDKLSLAMDISLSIMTTETHNLPNELKTKMMTSFDTVYEELDFLLEWITSPTYVSYVSDDNVITEK